MNAVDVFEVEERRRLKKQAWQRANKERTHLYTAKWSRKNPDKVRDRNKRNVRTLTTRWHMLVNGAKKRGLPMLLTREEYASFDGQPCFYCKLPLTAAGRSNSGTGLDRKSNDKSIGYTLENVVRCCGICNSLRSDILTVDEMLLLGPSVRLIREARERAWATAHPDGKVSHAKKETGPEIPIDAPRQILLKNGLVVTVTAVDWVGREAAPP